MATCQEYRNAKQRTNGNPVIIDFHTHTTASDGALDPRQVVDRALARGVMQLAITDHDSVAGFRAAQRYYTPLQGQMRLIPGVEYSCVWSGTTIHVVGLGMDCDHPAMCEGLALLDTARQARAEKIATRLEKLGFPGALAGARAQAGSSQLGRPHFAAWMVEAGHVKDRATAFDKHLGQGKTGDVKAYWPELADAVGWIVAAGGTAVLAHPLKYRFTRMKLRRLTEAFQAAGGGAIEVLNGRQASDQISRLRQLADSFGLQVSAGSDFHHDGPYTADIGVDVAVLAGTLGVWQRWAEGVPAKTAALP